MKVIGTLLVALTLFYQPGRSLICYYCPDETLSSECTDQRNCTGNQNVCKTTVLSPDVGFPFQGNEVVTRGCSVAGQCIPNDGDELGNSRIIFCCNSDLCNNRGINSTSVGNAAAQTGAVMIVFLLGISVPLIILRL